MGLRLQFQDVTLGPVVKYQMADCPTKRSELLDDCDRHGAEAGQRSDQETAARRTRLRASPLGNRLRPVPPHQRLQVGTLAEELGGSRTPIREALSRLARAQFMYVARNSYTQVAEWDASDICDRLEVVGRLACFIVRDPRVDVASLAQDAEADIETTDIGDMKAFLAFVERISQVGANRVAKYTLSELTEPLRMFYAHEVLQQHAVDLAPNQQSRLPTRATHRRLDHPTCRRHITARDRRADRRSSTCDPWGHTPICTRCRHERKPE